MNTDMKVLIVDDYSTMLRIIKNLLNQIGFTDIDQASDGKQALEKFKQANYGLVISDWNMEPMNGFEFLQAVRAGNHNNNVPFIMATAESKTENVIKAKEAGVSNYIIKPFNAETLKGKISSALAE